MAERFRVREGHYPSRILADKIYRNRENLSYCKAHGIRLSGPALGRPKKGETRDKAQDYRDECERVEVERRFSPDEPFVLTDMVTWGSERVMKELPPSEYDRQMLDCADWTVERLLEQGDSRIMGAFGYRTEGNLIRREKAPICDYLDLEYYRGSLDSSHKILQPVSTYLKGNCGIEFLLNAYCLLRQSTLPGQAE